MDSILDDLNPQQRQAVEFGEGPLLVVAGAGSGKTRVITRRIAHLLRCGEPADAILALTFTNKAAEEMATRVLELGGHRVHVSTFHSACARFLRVDGHRIGYPRSFSIYDTYDRDTCIKMVMQEEDVERGGAVRPAHVGRCISRLKNQRIGPQDFDPNLSELEEVTARVFGPYEERMRKLGAMDFDDLLLRFLDLLERHPEVAEKYRRRYRWILVDEFQDTNRVQYELVRALAVEHRNLCVVGDPDQSIYSFRGARIGNLLDLEKDFPDTVTIRLETNYRSTQTILDAANAVIRNNRLRKEKVLRTTHAGGEALMCVTAADATQEAREIAQQVAGLIADGTPADRIAVFYRAHYLSRALEEAFRRQGVPYQVIGGLSFFERREIKDLLAFLRVAINPLDDVGMERVINVPPRGVGKATLEKLRAIAIAEEMSLFEVVMDDTTRAGVSARARAGLDALAGMFETVREHASASAAAALKTVLQETGYVDYACGLGDPEDITRQENIEELLADAVRFDREHGAGLAGYLAHVSLLTSEDRRAEGGPRVSLMTVHAAKGLEFDRVFVAGLEEGVFPHSRSLQEDAALEEERRLMYVALTRAREGLFLSRCEYRRVQGIEMEQLPSRFLQELPEKCLATPVEPWRHWEPEAPEEQLALRPSMRVVHPVYGHGEVLEVTHRGRRAVVQFSDGSVHLLLPDHEMLQVMPGEGDT